MTLWLRFQCWWHGICFYHGEVKESDGYSWPYCQMCEDEGLAKRQEYKHEKRMELVRKISLLRADRQAK